MSKQKNVAAISDPTHCSSAMWKHPTGQWAKKKAGKVYYFGKDRETAEKRFALWEKTGVHHSQQLRQFVNAWLTDSLGQMSFDEWYASYDLARWFVDRRGPYAGVDACEEFVQQQASALESWDTVKRVYFITDGELVKIGISRKKSSRLSALQTANGRKLEMLFDVPGGKPQESRLHRRFSNQSTVGEWFTMDGDLESWIEQIREAWRSCRHVR